MRQSLPFDSFASLCGRLRRATIAALICAVGAGSLAAQDPAVGARGGTYATRAALEARALAAERAAGDDDVSLGARGHQRGEAFVLRNRLRDGDFAVGDRIVIEVLGETTLSDTFTVRTGPTLQLSNLPPISLAGVLRSELRDHLTVELSRYLRLPTVMARPLLRVAVMGQVSNPGFYHVPADVLLSDVLMLAGGPAEGADLERSEIRRGDDALLESAHFNIAVTDGLSLDALHLRSGDQVLLRERRRANWTSVLQFVSIASGLVTLLVSLRN